MVARAWFASEQHTVSTIHVLAAYRHHVRRQASEGLHQRRSLPVVAEDKVDYNIRRQLFENRTMLRQVIPVSMNPANRFRKRGLGFAAMKHRHFVPLFDERFDHERPDKSGTADDENPHLHH